MTNVSVIVYGKELSLGITTSYEVMIHGKTYSIIFLQNECIVHLNFDEQTRNDNKGVLFTGTELDVIFKTDEVVVFVGNVERITFINPKGEVVSSYKVNDCNSKERFTEIK